jgi:hypothetical protein
VFTVGNWYVSNKNLLLACEDGKPEFWERWKPFLILSEEISPISTTWFTIADCDGNSRRVSRHELEVRGCMGRS